MVAPAFLTATLLATAPFGPGAARQGPAREEAAQPAQAQASPTASAEQEPRPPAPDEPFWVPGETDQSLEELLRFCAHVQGLSLETAGADLSGRTRISPWIYYTTDELWQRLGRELEERGLTVVQPPLARALRVVPLERASQLARLEAPTLEGAQALFLRTLVPLEHAEPQAAAEALRPLLSQAHGSIVALDQERALLLADTAPRLRQALSLLARIDRPSPLPQVFTVPLEHASPITVRAAVEALADAFEKAAARKPLAGTVLAAPSADALLVVAPPGEVSWWKSAIERFDVPEPVVTREYVPRRFTLSETARLVEELVRGEGVGEVPGTWRLVPDPLTGALFITTTPSRHAQVEQVLTRLEATERGPRRPLVAFQIHHRKVGEVLALLRELVEAGAVAGATGAVAGATGAVAGATSAVASATGAVATRQTTAEPQRPAMGATAPLVTDRSLTLSGADEAESVTLTADEASGRILAFGPARVLDRIGLLIETLDVPEAQVLVEALVVTLTDDEREELGVELRHAGLSGSASFELASLFGLGAPGLDAPAIATPTASGFSGVVLNPGDFSALLHALRTVTRGRTLTVPKILVGNGREAVLDSLLQTPFTSTNASTTVATTSFGGTQDAGTAVRVTPQVADADRIVLDYSVSISSFVGEAADPALPPPRQETKLASVVAVPDGYTIALGGLEVRSRTEGGSRVPLLARLPLLGRLFESTTESRSRTRFFAFLRCSVMRSRSFEDLRYASERPLAEAGLEGDLPALEPRWIR